MPSTEGIMGLVAMRADFRSSTATYKNSGRQNESASEHHLCGCRDGRRIHVAPLDKRNRQKFEDYDSRSYHRRGVEVRDQVGECVTYAAGNRHEPTNQPAEIGGPA